MEAVPVIPPNPEEVLRAVDIYVKVAYGPDPLPLTVQSQLAVLRSWKGPFFRSPVIASDGGSPPRRYSLRLGNRQYPHMKLAIERSPDGQGYLFRPDTHDSHCCPPADHPEHGAYREMMAYNLALATKIEAALAAEGLATFKTFLQQDIARRQAERNGGADPAVMNPPNPSAARAGGGLNA